MMKIAVAMSGGVDSSVAAYLLKKEGYNVIGLTMLVTPSGEAANDARKVARYLDIQHYIIDLTDIFSKKIISDFCRQYSLGRTPNPCVQCNRMIKFGVLPEKAREFGTETIATGHYAIIEKRNSDGRLFLKKGVDNMRDQSYFLYSLTQEQLAAAIFPLGRLKKDTVRELAVEAGLPVANREESREICFIPDNDYPRFVREYMNFEIKPGKITDKQGTVLGRHSGIVDFTIGQRKGLGISSKSPLYVVGIDSATDTIIVGGKENVYAGEFIVTDLNWIAFNNLTAPMTVKTRIRYLHLEAESVITPVEKGKVKVRFTEPQFAVTPGQAAVFYDDDSVIGGGTIERVLH